MTAWKKTAIAIACVAGMMTAAKWVSADPPETMSPVEAGATDAGGAVPTQMVEPLPVPTPRQIQYLRTGRVVLNYKPARGSASVTRAEMWVTADRSRTWQKAEPKGSTVTGKAIFDAPRDGLYGLYLILFNTAGPSSPPPEPGTAPQQWVMVDRSAPFVQILEIRPDAHFSQNREINIRWKSQDDAPTDRPVTLSYRGGDAKQYVEIAATLEGTSTFRWTVPESVSGPVSIKAVALDRAGNTGENTVDSLVIPAATPALVASASPAAAAPTHVPTGAAPVNLTPVDTTPKPVSQDTTVAMTMTPVEPTPKAAMPTSAMPMSAEPVTPTPPPETVAKTDTTPSVAPTQRSAPMESTTPIVVSATPLPRKAAPVEPVKSPTPAGPADAGLTAATPSGSKTPQPIVSDGPLVLQSSAAHGEPPEGPSQPVRDAAAEARKRYDLASTYRRRGDNAMAMIKYREALELDPGLNDARNDLAGVLVLAGSYDAAEQEYGRVLERDAKYKPALKSLALVQAHKKNYRTAAQTLERLLAVDSTDSEAWLYLGDVTMFMGDRAAARQHWAKAAGSKTAVVDVKDRARKRLAIYSGDAVATAGENGEQ